MFELEATLIYYADGTIEATNEATLIGYSSNTDIVKLEVGSSCTTIGSNAFTGCTSLERLEIPNAGNTTYGWQPFTNCTGLKEVIMGGINKPVSTITPANIFNGCTHKELTIKIYVESGTTSLANQPWGATYATVEYYDATTGELVNMKIGRKYQGNTEIDWTEIPNAGKVTEIMNYAFSNCTKLALTSLPENITTIDVGTFQGCTNLKIEKIAERVTTIGSNAFTGCTSLERLEIPNAGNTTYGWQPFTNCTGLKEVIMGGINKPVSTITPANIFNGCTHKELTIKIYVESGTTSLANQPWGATYATVEYYDATTGELVNMKIGRKYEGNTEIDWTEIPNAGKVTEIMNSAFLNCTKLALTSLPENITTINNGTFQGCTNLKIEKIPEGVTTIQNNAFTGCTSLERLEIPNAGNIILGNYIFTNCTGLKEVVLGGINKPVQGFPTNTFMGCTQTGLIIKIYVASGTTSLANQPWGATKATIEYYDSTTGERIN